MEEESLFVVPPIDISSGDEDEESTSSDAEEGEEDSDGDEDAQPRPRGKPVDGDKTDDEVDYEEGIDRGFRAVRTRKEGRDFDGVMAAIEQMEDKSECAVMRQKLIEHVWALPKNPN